MAYQSRFRQRKAKEAEQKRQADNEKGPERFCSGCGRLHNFLNKHYECRVCEAKRLEKE